MQYGVALVFLALSSSGRLDTKNMKPTIVSWLIDGSNLQCCSGRGSNRSTYGRKDREDVIQEMKQMSSCSSTKMSHGNKKKSKKTPIANVILVFDGNEDEVFQKLVWSPWFQVVITDGEGKRKDRADDYIIEYALPELHDRFSGEQEHRHVVHLVSADKELRKRAVATRKMNGGSVVYPPKFWKQYLPNLQQKYRQQD